MTSTFLSLIRKSHDGRVIFITSGLYSLTITQDLSDPRNLEGFTVYRSTKCTLNMLMLQWRWELKSDGIKVWAVAPRFMATNVGHDEEGRKKLGAQNPSVAGKTICGVIEGKSDFDMGKLVRDYDSLILPWFKYPFLITLSFLKARHQRVQSTPVLPIIPK
jgi:NAD(P)-dependent dehydrogenase (short-subunit alcohol dehydrogenase family)